jgi:UDP-N-acetylmuramoyl-L-alanyl-D-glutamate--2,6-diaminopimelate ligase
MEAYFAAKAGLFTRLLPDEGVAVVNLDGAQAEMAQIALEPRPAVLTVGQGAGRRSADRRHPPRCDRAGGALSLAGPGAPGAAEPDRRLPGRERAVAAGLAIACGAAPRRSWPGCPRLTGVRGRMQLAATRGTAPRSLSTMPIRPTPSKPRCARCARM